MCIPFIFTLSRWESYLSPGINHKNNLSIKYQPITNKIHFYCCFFFILTLAVEKKIATKFLENFSFTAVIEFPLRQPLNFLFLAYIFKCLACTQSFELIDQWNIFYSLNFIVQQYWLFFMDSFLVVVSLRKLYAIYLLVRRQTPAEQYLAEE